MLKNREKRTNFFKHKTPADELDIGSSNGRQYTKSNSVDSLSSVFKDQLNAIKYLVDNFPNIDRKRIILIGYGTSAYTALSTLAEDNNNFIKAAIAIAPVVNWRLMGMKL